MLVLACFSDLMGNWQAGYFVVWAIGSVQKVSSIWRDSISVRLLSVLGQQVTGEVAHVLFVLVFPVNYSVAQVGCSAVHGAPSKWLS